MTGQPPIKQENAKPSFNFAYDSPDIRARNVNRGIYDDSSDDETPKKPLVNRIGFGTGLTQAPISTFPNLGTQGSMVTGGFVGANADRTPAVFEAAVTTVIAQAGFGSGFQNATPPASRTSPLFTAATKTTATARATPLSPFQKVAPQVTAASGTASLFTDATSQAAQAAVMTAFAGVVPQQPSTSPIPTTTAPMDTMAEKEESRLFAAHMKLLDHGSESQDLHEVSGTPLFTKKVLSYSEKLFSQYGFLAGISDILDANTAVGLSPSQAAVDPRLFFNISAPSSAFICGSQGSGKSHTLSCLLENCLMKSDVSRLDNPLAGLVFHYDSFTSDVKGTPCEAAHISSNSKVKVRILVSPTNIQTMKRTYASLNATVEPLRINQTDLNTKRMLDLMAVDQEAGKMPLYLHAISRILRDMRLVAQQNNTGFNYREFKRQVDLCDMTAQQLLPLNQRLDTLESFMPKSQTSHKPQSKNRAGNDPFGSTFGSNWSIKAGTLTIVDLSCPCVTAEGACALFNMCLSLFLEQHTTVGRVIGLDEAHKYMNAGAEASSLTNTLLSAIRLQRHLGTRVFISTQEPTISPKLLDLCSITIVHRFTSPDWLCELRRHLASLDNDEDSPGNANVRLMSIFNQIVKLRVGEALLFAPSAIIGVERKQTEDGAEETEMQRLGTGYLKIKIRARVTSDGGRSVFALGTQPTAKTAGNMFGFPAAKLVSAVPQAGSGGVGIFKPANLLVQFPSTKGLNDSVFTASSTATVGSLGSSQQATTFGAPSPAPAHTSMFSSIKTRAVATTALAFGSGNENFGPFQSNSAERTHIVGAFTTSTPSLFSMFSFGSVPAPGTRCTAFQPFIEKEPNSSTNQQNSFQSIGFQLPYQKFSPEELRLADYAVGVRYSGQWKFEGQFK